MFRRLIAALALALVPSLALAQAVPLHAGPFSPGHVPIYGGTGTGQPLIRDSGAANGTGGPGLSEMLLQQRGLGVAPFANTGTGPLGTNLCDYDGPTTGPYHFLCLGPNSQGGGAIVYGSGGGAAQQPLSVVINGQSYSLPGVFTNGALPLSGGTLTGGITSNATGGYWSSGLGIPAIVHRFNDRVFVGRATAYRGDSADTNETWSSTTGGGIFSYLERNAQFYVNSSYSEMAGFFASHTGDSANLPSAPGYPSACCSMGLAIMGLNDNTTTVQPAWGLYVTNLRLPGTGHILNELDTLNATGTVSRISPYGYDPNSITVGVWNMAGGEGVTPGVTPPPYPTTSASSAAYVVGNNGTKWDKGLVFLNNSIGQQADGSLNAIEMAQSMRLVWSYDASGTWGSFIDGETSTAATQMGMSFTDAGLYFWNSARTSTFAKIAIINNAVNFPVLTPAPTGNSVQIDAAGLDTSINLELTPKGGGKLLVDGPGLSIAGVIQGPLTTPATSSATCIAGTVEQDASYFYVCVASNHWRRAAITDF